MTKLFIAAFLVAHGAIHASYVSPRPPATAGGPPWPFELSHSWLLSPIGADADATRLLGLALTAVTVAAFALAALVVLGIVPMGLWLPIIIVAAGSSLGLLVLYFHPFLLPGVAIDIVLLWLALAASWTPESLLS